jgi:iron complex outermembrane receptor protein
MSAKNYSSVTRTGSGSFASGRVIRGALLGAASICAAGFAQAADSPAASDNAGLEEIVVTAQRKPEYAKDVPVAVTSLSAPTIDALTSSGEDIRFLAARVPSLQIESSFGRTYPRFYIRGLGNSDFTYNAQQPVGVVVDDVIVENPILKAFPVFDVKDIEVLRGPQGTLFGRNTPAGVVKIDTARPTDSYEGYADLSYGTYNTVDFTGVISGPIVPGLLDFRISVQEDRRDDWVTNVNPYNLYHKGLEGYTDTAGRLQLAYTPTDALSALFEFDGRTLDGTARVFRANIIEKGTNQLVPGFDIEKVNLNGDNYQNLGTVGTHLTIEDRFDGFTVTSISAYEHGSVRSRGDIDGGNFSVPPPAGSPVIAGFSFDSDTSDSVPGLDQLTEELRVATNGDEPFSNQAGFLYFHEYLHVEDFNYNTSDPAAGAVNVIQGQVQSTESFGIFDSAKYKITDDFTFGAGLRFSNDDKRYYTNCLLTCAVPTPSSIKTNTSQVTFDVNATYAITPDMNVYARIASGYLAPGSDSRNVEFDFGDAVGVPLSHAKAETTTSYEIGLKSELLDHKADFNLTAYYYNTDDIQLVADGGAGNGTQLLNAKKAIGEGIESEVDYKPIPPLFLSASASYNFTQIQDANLEVAGCGGGCTMLSVLDPATGAYHINGNPLPQAPRWIIDGSVKYTVPFSDATEMYFSTDWSFRSSVDFFLYKAVEYDSQTLLIGNLRIGYVDDAHGLEGAFFIHNIADEVRATGAIDFSTITGFVNEPRTFGGEVRYRF